MVLLIRGQVMKSTFANHTCVSLGQAMVGAYVFIGLVTLHMVKSMAANPIFFAKASLIPDIFPQVICRV